MFAGPPKDRSIWCSKPGPRASFWSGASGPSPSTQLAPTFAPRASCRARWRTNRDSNPRLLSDGFSAIDARAADLALPRWPPVALQSVDESFDCLEHWLLGTREEPMIIAVELNELSAGDLTRHIAASLNTHGPVVAAV
jgi:hypothetical protein